PYLGMVLSTTAQVGLIIISKRALASGMSNYTFVAYSNALAALLLLPLSLLVHKSSSRPSLSFVLVGGFLALGLLGCLSQLFGYTGIRYSSAAFASAMLNLVPGFTFLLAVIFRMERVSYRSVSFAAKAVGTVVSIGGAFIVTLYKGHEIFSLRSTESNFVIGGLFLSMDCMFASAFIIVQASILKKYPAELVIVFFYCLFAAILSALVSLFADNDRNAAWSLQPNIRLMSVLYSGVMGSAFQVGMNTWCLHKRGPLFVAMFKPLGILISAIIGIIFLGDALYLGSLVGSVVIVIGFYSVMWGKAKEVNNFTTDGSTPLLTS
ncbi:hypothetical protein M569_07421, partial [Genlisea aurea]